MKIKNIKNIFHFLVVLSSIVGSVNTRTGVKGQGYLSLTQHTDGFILKTHPDERLQAQGAYEIEGVEFQSIEELITSVEDLQYVIEEEIVSPQQLGKLAEQLTMAAPNARTVGAFVEHEIQKS